LFLIALRSEFDRIVTYRAAAQLTQVTQQRQDGLLDPASSRKAYSSPQAVAL
jgi:ribonuclease D